VEFGFGYYFFVLVFMVFKSKHQAAETTTATMLTVILHALVLCFNLSLVIKNKKNFANALQFFQNC